MEDTATAGAFVTADRRSYDDVVELSPGKRLFFVALVTSLCATAAIAIFTLIFAEFDETAGRILATSALISLFSLLSLPAGVLLDQGRYTALAWAILAIAAAAFLLSMVVVWVDWDEGPGDGVWKSLVTLAAFSAGLSQTGAATSRRRDEDSQGVRILYVASIALVFLVAAMASLAAWEEIEDSRYYRALGALVVANVLVVLLQPILRRLAGVPTPAAAPPSGGHKLVFELDGPASDEAVAEARTALERGGARVSNVDRSG